MAARVDALWQAAFEIAIHALEGVENAVEEAEDHRSAQPTSPRPLRPPSTGQGSGARGTEEPADVVVLTAILGIARYPRGPRQRLEPPRLGSRTLRAGPEQPPYRFA